MLHTKTHRARLNFQHALFNHNPKLINLVCAHEKNDQPSLGRRGALRLQTAGWGQGGGGMDDDDDDDDDLLSSILLW